MAKWIYSDQGRQSDMHGWMLLSPCSWESRERERVLTGRTHRGVSSSYRLIGPQWIVHASENPQCLSTTHSGSQGGRRERLCQWCLRCALALWTLETLSVSTWTGEVATASEGDCSLSSRHTHRLTAAKARKERKHESEWYLCNS